MPYGCERVGCTIAPDLLYEVQFASATSTDRSSAQPASSVPVASIFPLEVVAMLLASMLSATMISFTLSARLPPSAKL